MVNLMMLIILLGKVRTVPSNSMGSSRLKQRSASSVDVFPGTREPMGTAKRGQAGRTAGRHWGNISSTDGGHSCHYMSLEIVELGMFGAIPVTAFSLDSLRQEQEQRQQRQSSCCMEIWKYANILPSLSTPQARICIIRTCNIRRVYQWLTTRIEDF